MAGSDLDAKTVSEHCASMRERPGHHEKPDEKPTTPAQPEHAQCPGCDLPPLVQLDLQKFGQDSQRTLFGYPGDDSQSPLNLSGAFFLPDAATRFTARSDSAASARRSWRRRHSSRIGFAVPIYIDIQSLLI